MPQRLQRTRDRNWRKPEHSIICTSPGPFGNPFRIGCHYRRYDTRWRTWAILDEPFFGSTEIRDLAQSLQLWEQYARARIQWHPEWLTPLRDHDLICWCDLAAPCHVDLLLELANT